MYKYIVQTFFARGGGWGMVRACRCLFKISLLWGFNKIEFPNFSVLLIKMEKSYTGDVHVYNIIISEVVDELSNIAENNTYM